MSIFQTILSLEPALARHCFMSFELLCLWQLHITHNSVLNIVEHYDLKQYIYAQNFDTDMVNEKCKTVLYNMTELNFFNKNYW